MLYYTILYYTIILYTMLYYTILYYIIISMPPRNRGAAEWEAAPDARLQFSKAQLLVQF